VAYLDGWTWSDVAQIMGLLHVKLPFDTAGHKKKLSFNWVQHR